MSGGGGLTSPLSPPPSSSTRLSALSSPSWTQLAQSPVHSQSSLFCSEEGVGSDWPLAPVLPAQAQLACPSTRSQGMETQSLWGAGVGRGRSSSRHVTSPLDIPNTLEALKVCA